MPFIILKEPGFEGFTGLFGTVEFENGRSVESISNHEAKRFGAITRCETEDGINPSPSQDDIDRREQAASEERATVDPTTEELKAQEQAQSKPALSDLVQGEITRERLEQIADKSGIAGLRKIAEPLGIKDKSVPGLINKILELTGNKGQ